MTTSEPRNIPLLKRSHFLVILAAVVLFFLVGLGPVWQDPFDYWKLGRSIIWSYVPIPFLVFAFLAISRRLGFASWLASTAIMVATKFGVTATIMVCIWALSGPPPTRATDSRPSLPEFLPAPRPPAPPPVEPSQAGRVTGRVLDASGQPIAGAIAWLDGLAPHAWPARTDTVVLTNDGNGLQPADAAVQAGQRLVLRSLDGRIHTMAGELPGGAMAFNRPILPNGPDHPIMLPLPGGHIAVRCTVHPMERPSRLVLLAHPFFATTAADGTFAFDGVPVGHVEALAAVGGRDVSAGGELKAGATLSLVLAAKP